MKETHVRELATLNAQIDAYDQAIRLHPSNSADLAPLLNNLAVRLRRRWETNGDAADLRRAVKEARAAVAAGHDTADIATYLNTLANCLDDQFTESKEYADLDAAITAHQNAVKNSRDPADRQAFIANLASALAERYRHNGVSADLDQAIEMVEQIPTDGMQDPVERAGLAANHAGLLQDRFAVTGSLDDLNLAIEVARRALVDALPSSATTTMLHTNLGGALQSRYDHLKDPADLEAVLQEFTDGLGSSSIGAPGRAQLLNNLAVAFAARARTYEGERKRSDLHRSVTTHRLALAASGKSDRALYANGLAAALLDRYQETGRRRDLLEAVRIWRRAVAETSATAPQYARRLGNFARATALRFDRRPRRRLLVRARTSYRQSCVIGLDTDPESVLSVAVDWGAWAMRRSAPTEAADAYDFAADAIDRLLRVQLLRSHKEAWLSAAPAATADGSLAHARSGDRRAAAFTLERGRAQLLSEALQQGRTDLTRLHEEDRADLAERFQAAASRLASLQATVTPR